MKLARKSLVISVIFAINATVQLINQIVMARIFGASEKLEIFLAAVAIPTMLVSGIYATLNDAFLPIYGKLKQQKNEADKFLQESFGGLFLFGIVIATTLAISAKKISWWLYSERGLEFVEQVANEMKILVWGIPIAIGVVILGSVWYAKKKFIQFPTAQMIGNITILIGVIVLGKMWGEISLVSLFLISLLVQGIIVGKEFKGIKFSWQKSIKVVKAWIPIIISFIIFRSDGVIVKYFAGKLETGYIVYLNLASKLMIMAIGVVTIGIQILLLPHLVENLNDKAQIKQGVNLINKAKITSIGMAIITGALMMFLLPWILDTFFVGGRFTVNDVMKVKSLLKWFLLPAIGLGVYPIFMQPLIALNKQKIVAIIAMFSGLVAWITAVWGSWISMNVVQTMTLTLSSLVFTGIILSEIVWQKEKIKLLR